MKNSRIKLPVPGDELYLVVKTDKEKMSKVRALVIQQLLLNSVSFEKVYGYNLVDMDKGRTVFDVAYPTVGELVDKTLDTYRGLEWKDSSSGFSTRQKDLG